MARRHEIYGSEPGRPLLNGRSIVFLIEAIQNTLEKFTSILRENRIRFDLTGGATRVAYAELSMTQDIDIVVDNAAFFRNFQATFQALSNNDFLFDEQSVRPAIGDRKMFQLLDLAGSLKLDIYPRELVEGELDSSRQI